MFEPSGSFIPLTLYEIRDDPRDNNVPMLRHDF